MRAGLVLTALAATAPAGVPEAYRAEWAGLRPKLDANIERYRKGDVTIQVFDSGGKAVADAKLSVRQKSNAFYFGCNILVLGQLGEQNETYERKFAGLFNLATTTFTWLDVEPQPGKFRFAADSEEIWRRPPPDRVVAFGRKHGIALKGQPLMCDHWTPAWAPKDPVELKKAYQSWFAKVAERYGRSFQIFDVENEALIGRPFVLNTPDHAYVDWAFRETRRVFPSAPGGPLLAINEGTEVNGPRCDRYFSLVKRLVDTGAGVGAVGFQFHLFNLAALQNHLNGKAYPPSQILATYEKFAGLGLPLFITEITVPSTLEQGRAGEEIQAEVLANLYRLWFSVPAMAGIIHWNLLDGAAWKGENAVYGGLLDPFLREKPAYQALYQLIKREWSTDLEVKTDARGEARFRAFYGRYSVTVRAGGKTQTTELQLAKDHREPLRLTVQ